MKSRKLREFIQPGYYKTDQSSSGGLIDVIKPLVLLLHLLELVHHGFESLVSQYISVEIAVDQQTKAHNRTFEVVPDSGCPWDSHALIWSIFGSILPNHLNMLKTVLWGALL